MGKPRGRAEANGHHFSDKIIQGMNPPQEKARGLTVCVSGGWGEPANETEKTHSLKHAFWRRVPTRPLHAVLGAFWELYIFWA